jgi:hypothetical protein
MVRTRLYEAKVIRKKGCAITYVAGCYKNLPSELIDEWTVGEPPAAWREDQERPECWPPKPEPEPESEPEPEITDEYGG